MQVLELMRVAQVLPAKPSGRGWPLADRAALGRAFLRKAVFDMPTTRALVKQMQSDASLRRPRGWEAVKE